MPRTGRPTTGAARTTARRPGGARPGAGRGAKDRPAGRRVVGEAGGAGGRSPREAEQHRISRTTLRWLVLGSLLLLVMVILGPTLVSWYQQSRQIARLQDQVAAQEADVQRLRHERELWQSDEYVVRQARERLGFVKVGDKAYTLLDADPKLDDGRRSGAWVDSDSPWYGQLWQSTTAADNPNVTP